MADQEKNIMRQQENRQHNKTDMKNGGDHGQEWVNTQHTVIDGIKAWTTSRFYLSEKTCGGKDNRLLTGQGEKSPGLKNEASDKHHYGSRSQRSLCFSRIGG